MSDFNSTLTAERLRELLDYNQETGVFTRLVRTAQRVRVGDTAGCKDTHGYLLIMIDRRPYKAHRLAWLHVHGVLPASQIDHIDGNPANNRISNLRDVSCSVNQQNRKLAQNGNKLGVLGVSRHGNKFRTRIVTDGKMRHIGVFDTPELAHAAYLAVKRRIHEGCTI